MSDVKLEAEGTSDRTLALRERKKLRTRQALIETALALFTAHGFATVTLDDLVDEVEVSKRTFFRYFGSKEEVATATEGELWDAYVRTFEVIEQQGTALAALRHALIAALESMDDEWERRFLTTRALIGHTPPLRDHSNLASLKTQERLVEALEKRLGVDSREDVRLRMLGELAMGAWRCGARNWVRTEKRSADGPKGTRGVLIRRVGEAFDAIPSSLTLTAP